MTTNIKYLDPKADLTFKKIFAGHPDLLISLLNALLPLKRNQQIKSIEYLPTELVPVDPLHKDTIVDVRCRDVEGRQFVVEMQMAWTDAFKQRVLFNASKAYVSQAEMGCKYEDLQPVYSLNLVNEIFEKDMKEYKHNYHIVHDKRTKKVIEGLCFTFIELPKFHPHTMKEKRMTVLWLRFLTEINDKTQEVPAELLESPEISKALEEVKISAFTAEELRAYDKFWDRVSSEKTLMEGRYDEGKQDKALEIAQNLKSAGMDVDTICKMTGLSKEEIEEL
ncbi:MAG: Rpn family recombination-promoting nuclease/putative transposase [Prevotella sp.]|jgi:predicted transposase/invertase (TIGR01784 family)